jgi:hypothetical protein
LLLKIKQNNVEFAVVVVVFFFPYQKPVVNRMKAITHGADQQVVVEALKIREKM